MANEIITQEYLKKLFDYRDGDIYWKVARTNAIKVGQKAGSLNHYGYLITRINNKLYKNHRLIFLIFNGYLPKFINHIDGNLLNNKIENLKEIKHSKNIQNSKKRNDNTSGVKNVHWNKKNKKWRVQLTINGKQKCFGSYDNLDMAELVAQKARNKYYGEYAKHK